MAYTSSTWAITKEETNKLDAAHRKHLRTILNIKWYDKITNEQLYTRANVEVFSKRMTRARWRMLGRVLRLPENRPASLALKFAMEKMKVLPPRRGRPITNLYELVVKDIKKIGQNLKTIDDFYHLQSIAKNENEWNKLI